MAAPVPAAGPLAAAPPLSKLDPAATPYETGRVTWYKRSRHTHTTASGEALDDRLFTAAHRRLPFGSFIRVTDAASGHSVIVRINDRGPFTKGFILDLSKAAAEALGLFNHHQMIVGLEILAEAPRMHPAATEISTLPTGKAALAALAPTKAGTRKSATQDSPRAIKKDIARTRPTRKSATQDPPRAIKKDIAPARPTRKSATQDSPRAPKQTARRSKNSAAPVEPGKIRSPPQNP